MYHKTEGIKGILISVSIVFHILDRMCGNLENRQVSSNRPQLVNSLSAYCVTDVAVGGEHTLALTSNHLVFSWGSNTDGQVGL